jgi:hypothetical protein
MRQFQFLLSCSLFAAASALAQPAPVPPVAPPPPQPGQAQPLAQDRPEGIAPAPGTTAEVKQKWDVSARHGPGREVAIDTRRGTWMSLDVSPDGSEIAFDLLGDIYVMPITGGEARPILTGHAWEMQPRYSPNGQEISFTSDRDGGDNIWTVRRDGSAPRQITKEDFHLLNQADWTADGNYIVARKHFTSARSLGAGEMWLYHRTGSAKGGGVQMTKARTKQKDTNEPAFSPDGRYLYFSDDATPGDIFQYSKDVNGQIYVIQRLDRQTGEIETLVDGPGGAIRPTPSPGRQEPGVHPARPVQIDADADGPEVRPHHSPYRHARSRHAGNLGGAWRLSGDELDARQQVHCLLGQGRHPPDRRRLRSAARNSIPRSRYALGGECGPAVT